MLNSPNLLYAPLNNFSLVRTKQLAGFLSLIFFAWYPTSLRAIIDSPGAKELGISENDWPWWRGPNRNGHAQNQRIPTEWDETKNIIWKTPIPGRGHSTPTVVGESVFLLTSDEANKTQSAMCLNRSTGALQWITQLHQGGWLGRIHDRNSQATPTIACDGKRIFATFMYNEQIWLSALNINGEILWQKKASEFSSHWGYSTSPAIYNNLVIVSADHKNGGELTGFDQETGKVVWKTSRPQIPNYASPVIFSINGQDQLILPGCEILASYNPSDGKLNWSSPVTTQETVGSAVTDGQRIYASGGWPKTETACVSGDGTGELIWRNSIKVYAPSMLVTKGHLYTMTDNGFAYCWNTETGKMMWRNKFGGNFSASLVLVGDQLFASSEQGKTVIFKANPEAFEIVAENQLGDEIWATPVICGDRIYLRVAHHEADGRQEVLYCIGG
ncbi:MAG: PQQ-binding-like beta-propeller repeat protein [Verrucomicrobia bacterium]|nr:PQQ-binding-like beta-propeller repeat protein [Verrucomicrobiota bacterium]MDA1065969.1 PQQ-binding-like beta-propeller repeat protein [Verrucomicrobiota bacterium]